MDPVLPRHDICVTYPALCGTVMTTFAGLITLRTDLVTRKDAYLTMTRDLIIILHGCSAAILGQLYPITIRGAHFACGPGVDHLKRNTAKNGARNMKRRRRLAISSGMHLDGIAV